MEIDKVCLSRLNDGTHLFYHSGFYTRIKTNIETTERLADTLADYKKAIDREEKIQKVLMDDVNIVKLDGSKYKYQDSLYAGIKNSVKAQLAISNPDIHQAALDLFELFEEYDIERTQLADNETAWVAHLVYDLENKYAVQIEKLAFGSFLFKLKQAYKLLRAYMAGPEEERTVKHVCLLKEARKVTDEAYQRVVKKIDAVNIYRPDKGIH